MYVPMYQWNGSVNQRQHRHALESDGNPLRFSRFSLEPHPVAVVAELVDAQR